MRNSLAARKLTEEIFRSSDSGDEPPPLEGSSTDEHTTDGEGAGASNPPNPDTRLSIIATPADERAWPRPSDAGFLTSAGDTTDDPDYQLTESDADDTSDETPAISPPTAPT